MDGWNIGVLIPKFPQSIVKRAQIHPSCPKICVSTQDSTLNRYRYWLNSRALSAAAREREAGEPRGESPPAERRVP
jgi:hypothetical protein